MKDSKKFILPLSSPPKAPSPANPRHYPRRKEICLYDLDRLGLILLEPPGYYNTAFKGFTCAGAILTWDNSD
jgi:hypothetical protein